MQSIIQSIIFGLAYGSMYALLALAIGILISTTSVINFAYSSVVMIGAMVAYWCIGVYHLPYIVGLLAGMVFNGFLCFLLYKLCVEKLGDLRGNIGWIITLFGASLIINNMAMVVFGLQANPFPRLMGETKLIILGANIYAHEIIMIVIAAVIGVSYQTMCVRTKIGRALRAVSTLPQAAKLMGINSTSIIILSFILSGAVSAIAGCLIAPYTYASYTMALSIGTVGFSAAVIGGLGNTKGAFVGGLFIGLFEQLLSRAGVPQGYLGSFRFVIMILVLIFFPGGIMNAKAFRRAK